MNEDLTSTNIIGNCFVDKIDNKYNLIKDNSV